MKILHDDIIFLLQSGGGISRYWLELKSRLNEIDGLSIQHSLLVRLLIKLENKIRCSVFARTISLNLLVRVCVLFVRVMPVVSFRSAHIYHSSYYRPLLCFNLFSRPVRFLTVHDFMPELYGSGLSKLVHQLMKHRALMNSDIVICVSESTRRDLMRLYPKFDKPVHVIYNGAEIRSSSAGLVTQALPENYFLYVGQRSGCKNFRYILKHFGKSGILKSTKARLICVGGGRFEQELTDELLSWKMEEDCLHLGFVSDDELVRLYTNAIALLMVSKYEGFGIPAIEAQHLGCLVIDSGTGALSEVVGYDDLRFNLNNGWTFLNACWFALECRQSVRTRLVSSGRAHSKKFSWAATALDTWRLYEKYQQH